MTKCGYCAKTIYGHVVDDGVWCVFDACAVGWPGGRPNDIWVRVDGNDGPRSVGKRELIRRHCDTFTATEIAAAMSALTEYVV